MKQPKAPTRKQRRAIQKAGFETPDTRGPCAWLVVREDKDKLAITHRSGNRAVNDERYEGAKACKKFIKRGSEKVAKKQYWTKCGRQFEKFSSALVTGYELGLDELGQSINGMAKEEECAKCPFKTEVKEGWPPVHKRWECRAGSQEPNHKTEWTGSLENKNSIDINSLDNNFMETVIEYCKEHPDLKAAYNTDHLADCRRTISISCSQNKKGIAAKKALIEKFFSGEDAALDERFEDEDPADKLPACDTEDCLFNDRTGHCCFDEEDPESDGYHRDVIGAVLGYNCKRDKVLITYQAITEPDSIDVKESSEEPETCANCSADKEECQPYQACMSEGLEPEECICKDWRSEPVTKVIDENACPHGKLSCDCRCIGFSGVCDVIRRKDWDRYWFVKEMQGKVKCETFDKLAAEIIAEKNLIKQDEVTNAFPSVNEGSVIMNVQPGIVNSFDYSAIDHDTAEFLQEKANRITEIRIKSVIALGKEFKEARDKLSSHNKYDGIFGKWTESLSISRQTAQNYIQAYEYVVKNFDNIDAADNMQPSLLFAVSKPSAPAELQEKVLSGDIKTHKEYKELEDQLKKLHEDKRKSDEHYQRMLNIQDDNRIKAELAVKKAEKERDNTFKAYQKDLKDLNLQLEQAKRNGDPEKVRELGQKIAGYQEEIQNYQQQIGNLNTQLDEVKKQLKDKPIEAQAAFTVEKEVIPFEIKDAIYSKVASLFEGLLKLTDKEIQIFAEGADPDYYNEIVNRISSAIGVLNNIDSAVCKAINSEGR